jgi:hypothetical protein
MIEDFLVYSLNNRLLIFKFNDYLDIIEKNIFEYVDEWNLLTENYKIPERISYFEEFMIKSLKEQIFLFKSIQKKTHSKGIVIFNEHLNSGFSKKFENYESFKTTFKKVIKKLYKQSYFVDLQFNTINGVYLNIKCVEPNGEESEFLQKNNLTF